MAVLIGKTPVQLIEAIIRVCGGIAASALVSAGAHAQCSAVPNTITTGLAVDATKVMGNFNHLTGCVNGGQLTIPPAPNLKVTGPGGGTITIDNPSSASPYTLGLPANAGTNGQALSTSGSTQASWTSPPSAPPSPLVDGFPVGRPAASTLSWINQGSASYIEHANGPITLTIPASGSDQIRALGKAPPGSAPYTLTAKLSAQTWGANFAVAGLYIQDSSGKIVYLNQAGTAGNRAAVQVNYFNSASSFNSTPKSWSTNGYSTFWLRIRNDGTNWNYYWSLNGADWVSVYSTPLTAFLGSTITSLGVFGNLNNSTYPNMEISVWSFELTTGSGTDSSWQ